MKLAEALSIRADLQKRVAQLKKRLKDCPKLIYRINVTNLHTCHEGETLTGLIACRDVLSMRVSLMREVLDYASEREDRYSRSEIRYVRIADIPALRKRIDDYAQQLRKLDVRIQSLNWTTELE